MGTVVIIYFSYLSFLLFIYLFIYLFDTTRREHVMIGLFSLHYFFHFSFFFFFVNELKLQIYESFLT